jgi:hypothetical protein
MNNLGWTPRRPRTSGSEVAAAGLDRLAAVVALHRGRGGIGVGVAGPTLPYFASMPARTSGSDLPAARIAITSRVMSRQWLQVAAWLVKVMVPSGFVDLM